MPLDTGTRFGPYEIVGRLGAGGMGEVYRARDNRLGREVALKVLPVGVADDPARRARFEQEARAAAALNHPNITGLHDVGEEGGVSYIVTELVPGETLEALLERGPVPNKKLLDIAVQVADGMAAAHAVRIAHRDLKPANLMITPEGRVKILDFGLAKQASAPTSDAPDQTLTVHQTEPGMILGTVSYMSPEQARGKPSDYRSDQFSFGLILYEMAAGRKAFQKAESVQTMSAILTEDPPPIDRPIPAPLRWAMERCLAKEPGDRYESTRDLFHELRHLRDHLAEASGTQSGVTPAPAAIVSRRRIPLAVPAAFAAGLLIAGALAYFLSGPQFPDQTAYRFTPFSFAPGGQGSAVWSPNGKAVAYSARPNKTGPSHIFVRYSDAATPAQITNLPEDANPIGWAPDNMRILFRTSHAPAGIWSVSSVGGEPEPFMAVGGNAPADVSPDLKAVAVLRRNEEPNFNVWIKSPVGAPPKRYEPNPFATSIVYNQPRLRFSPDGKSILMFMHSERHREEAWLLPYPPNGSAPRRILEDLPSYGGTPYFTWMPDSRRILLSLYPVADSASQIWIADTRSGQHLGVSSSTGDQVAAAVSPDGERLLVSEASGNFDIVSVEFAGGLSHRMISTERNEVMPAYAARSDALVYVTDRNGSQEIWLQTGLATDRPIVTARDFPAGTTQWFMAPALSADASRVIYTRMERDGGAQVWISAVSGGAPVRLTSDKATEFSGSFSPDGTWFAYHAIHNGKKDLMKVKVSGQAASTLVKAAVEGEVPVWSPTGEWILAGDQLISPDGQRVQEVGDHKSSAYAFSPDGKLLYGLRPDGNHVYLFSMPVTGGAEKAITDIGREFRPASNLHPGIRFSVAPDGKSFIYSVGEFKTNLWMLEGFAPKPGFFSRFGLR